MKTQNNIDIREKAKSSGILLWEVSEAMGITEWTLSRKLRRELPQEEKDRVFEIIDRLAAEEAAR